MGTLSVDVFNYVQRFACLVDRCEDTCCKDWRISVSERDRGLFGQALPLYENLIVKDSDGYQIAKGPDGHCVALTGGACKVHAQHGEKALSNICANFPRMFRLINGSLVKAASMGCPEVARLCLYGEDPFRLEEAQQDDFHLGDVRDQSFEDLQATDRRAVVKALLDLVLESGTTTGQALVRVFTLAERLEPLPHSQWAGAIPRLMAEAGSLAIPVELLAADPLLEVLAEAIQQPKVAETLRRRAATLSSGDAYRGLYQGEVRSALDAILKRFIAAEMTRIGFPFVSITSAGQDYGLNLVEWAANLAVRTLTLRHLLLAHVDPEAGRAPEPAVIVEVVYRFCRAVSHSPAVSAEKALRQAIGERGAGYLAALIALLPED
ncbi:flagellin lysine-N-methylase [Pseudomonas indica]|uniref:Lysine-N-methylase n=1 Tax=Pseudomonas indica TaxID=137658 RepID=A0A1G9HG27_9PSED|nr:flagellin lysine-N-methylase [Pseudomonas indica]SDL11847.1 lysine-N-methylase [Pseudomonas indica]